MKKEGARGLAAGVIVLGVHRSGTSLLTAAVRDLGFALGDFPLKVGEENPKGYFEHPEIRAFNDRLFEFLGASWDNWGFFSGAIDFSTSEFSSFREEANALLHRCFGGLGGWAVKDPRMTHLLPFWEAVFSEYGIKTKRVMVIRNPGEIIESQMLRYRRNPKFHYALSEASAIAAWWVVIMLGVFKTLKDDNTFLISHADLYDKTVDTMQACARFLNISASREASQRFADEFVDQGLRRSRSCGLAKAGAWGAAAQQIFATLGEQPTPRQFTADQAAAIWERQAELRALLPFLLPVVNCHHVFKSTIAKSAPLAAREQMVTAYVSELVDGAPRPYSGARKGGGGYLLDGKRLQVTLSLPGDLGQLVSLRLDISDQVAIVELHALSIVSAQGKELWRWDGGSAVFDRLTRMICVPDKQGVTFVCHENDPQMLLKLPAPVLASIGAGARLHFDMTPYPLQERLTSVLTALQAARQDGAGAKGKLAPFPAVAGQLEDLADSLRRWLAARDEQIARQSQRLAEQEAAHTQTRHDLIRAQAQLELLKEVMQARAAVPERPPAKPRRGSTKSAT